MARYQADRAVTLAVPVIGDDLSRVVDRARAEDRVGGAIADRDAALEIDHPVRVRVDGTRPSVSSGTSAMPTICPAALIPFALAMPPKKPPGSRAQIFHREAGPGAEGASVLPSVCAFVVVADDRAVGC